MKIAIAKEIEIGEFRVALVPDTVARLVKGGFEVLVQTGAGAGAHFSDDAYEAAGAKLIADPAQLWGEADLLLKVSPPSERDGQPEINWLKPGAVLLGMLDPLSDPAGIKKLADRQITAFSLELIPRTSRAQSMDALSSQANIAGYKATLLAAAYLPRIFPMMTTAAGTIPPAKVLVIGAGVAGLQVIATARRLGAVVEAFDIRPAVKEEVQSVGAKFIDITLEEDAVADGGYAKEVSTASQERVREVLTEHVKRADVVITTAQVPGKRAPLIVTESMVAQMKPGSVIVDIAAEQGGNCAYTEPGKDVTQYGVTIIGPINLPASVPIDASQMYAKNVLTLVQYLVKDGELKLDFADDIIDSACVTHAGEIRNSRVREALSIPV
ncbi:NAD/NADP transhydrogenase alpha subunit [Pleurocapsa sp. PCC 7327]|uniref:Re/Si-specific NAD(P)(+) transhydrogenase subunit alpha n=1 Tax=Pleurocapsa sp. PCC 7327 TaxID=118163 RepID=UPI00029FE7E6|nr:Re/Si-specific NAD(P)(+) transhydrogenase subunit alpha [Pleurocapsa sp. PCC 7327]AFY76523.1 NAD/NADP transhydrogenase alpha subunit [Pleurocapsa sp. PCC 7327]